MTKFRAGDRVSVEGVVVCVSSSKRSVDVEIDDGAGGKERICVLASVPKLLDMGPAQVGDTVIINGNEAQTFSVIGIHEDVAWCKRGGGFTTALLSNLVVVERA